MAISYRAAQTLIKRSDAEALQRALDERLNANLSNENGWTLLMLAAVEGNVAVGTALLAAGANKAATNKKGETATSIATARNHTDFLALLNG